MQKVKQYFIASLVLSYILLNACSLKALPNILYLTIPKATHTQSHPLTISLNDKSPLPFIELETFHSLTPEISNNASYYSISPQRLDDLTYRVTNLYPGYYRYRARTCNKDACSGWTYSQVVYVNYEQVKFGEIRGHTGKLDKIAVFSVRLGFEPSENITVNIISSDTNEGIVSARRALPSNNHITQLMFTPDNWNDSQHVKVTGTNPNPPNNTQNYQISLSIEGDELNQYSVKMRGLGIDLSVRERFLDNFIADTHGYLYPTVQYAGKPADLSLHLIDAPSGMNIDATTGKIRWTAPKVYHTPNTEKYSLYTPQIRATDGVRETFMELKLEVPKLKRLPTELTQQTNRYQVTVTDSNNNLNNLSISFDNELLSSSVNVEQLVSWPAYPDSITRASEVFMLDNKVSGNVKLRLPIGETSEWEASHLKLYIWNHSEQFFSPFWSSARKGEFITDEKGTNYIEFTISFLKEPFFIGYPGPVPLMNISNKNSSSLHK